MGTILSAIVSIFASRFRSRAALELKLIALQHQLAVLRRQRPGRPQLSSLDRLLWVWLYRIRPRVLPPAMFHSSPAVPRWSSGRGNQSGACEESERHIVHRRPAPANFVLPWR